MSGWIAAGILYVLGIPMFVALGEHPEHAGWRSYAIASCWPLIWPACVVSGIRDELNWRRRSRG